MAAKKKAKQPNAKKAPAAHSVHQFHMVLGTELHEGAIRLRVVQPGVSGAPVGTMTVPFEFGRLLSPRMLLKTTLSIEGVYERPKTLGTGGR